MEVTCVTGNDTNGNLAPETTNLWFIVSGTPAMYLCCKHNTVLAMMVYYVL